MGIFTPLLNWVDDYSPQKNMGNNGSLDPSTGWWTWFESHGVTSLVKNHVRNKLLIP